MKYVGDNLSFVKRGDFKISHLKFYNGNSLGKKFNFLCIFTLSVSLTFQKNANYASTLNIREVIKFYNLGNKTFETDFNYSYKIGQ